MEARARPGRLLRRHARSSGRSGRPTTSPARCWPPRIDGDRLTDEEIIAFLFLMVVAGNETTTKLLGQRALPPDRRTRSSCDRVFADPDAARRPGRAVDRGDAALRHLEPDARAAPARRTSSCTARSRPQGSKLRARARLGQPRRPGLRRPGPLRHLPRQGRARAAAQLRRRSALLPGRQPGPARGADRAARAGASGRAASRSTTTPAGGCTPLNVRGFASVPVRMEVR